MDELLERELRKPSLIKNPRVLDLKYIPKKLLHREEEQKMLIQYFKPVIEKPGEYSQRVSIIGPIGSGKTAMALKTQTSAHLPQAIGFVPRQSSACRINAAGTA